MKIALFFKSELACEKKIVLLFLILTITVSLVDIICPFLTQQLIDVAIPQQNLSIILLYSLVIICSLLFAYLIYLGVVRYAGIITEKAVYAKRRKLIGQILAKDPVFLIIIVLRISLPGFPMISIGLVSFSMITYYSI